MDSMNEIRENVYKLCEKISFIANQLDVKVRPYSDISKVEFEQCSPADCLRVHEVLKQYFTLLHKVFHENKIKTSKDLFCYVLKELDLQVSDSFIKSIDEKDVIEIYNLEGMQVFRNFQMFKLSNYTLLEMVCMHWFDLFERDQDITDEIALRAREVLANIDSESQSWLIGDHLLKEKKSDQKDIYVIQMGNIAPVTRSDGELFGFASTLIAKKHDQAA